MNIEIKQNLYAGSVSTTGGINMTAPAGRYGSVIHQVDVNIGFASLDELDRLWPLLVKDIQHACERGDQSTTAGTLLKMCRSGSAFLCIVHNETGIKCASIWRFEGDAFHCWTLTGKDMRDWLNPLFNFIKNVARENGARRLTARGRTGWTRLFKTTEKFGEDYEVLL